MTAVVITGIVLACATALATMAWMYLLVGFWAVVFTRRVWRAVMGTRTEQEPMLYRADENRKSAQDNNRNRRRTSPSPPSLKVLPLVPVVGSESKFRGYSSRSAEAHAPVSVEESLSTDDAETVASDCVGEVEVEDEKDRLKRDIARSLK
jgi:hypothetical protein